MIPAKIHSLLFALGLSIDQIWPSTPRNGRRTSSFWVLNEHRLLEILDLAHRGWKKKMKKVYPRQHNGAEQDALALNIIYFNVKKRFASHGVTLNLD